MILTISASHSGRSRRTLQLLNWFLNDLLAIAHIVLKFVLSQFVYSFGSLHPTVALLHDEVVEPLLNCVFLASSSLESLYFPFIVNSLPYSGVPTI